MHRAGCRLPACRPLTTSFSKNVSALPSGRRDTTFVAQCLGLLTWVCGLFLARAVLARIASDTIRVGLMVFGLFPLLGVWSAADPVADLLATRWRWQPCYSRWRIDLARSLARPAR